MLIAVYCFLGSIIPILILLLGGIMYRRNKSYFKKKKYGDEFSPIEPIKMRTLVFWFLVGLALLFFCARATFDLWEEHQLWRRLDHRGEIQTVPLTRGEINGDMRHPSYYVVYEYNGTTHEDRISRELYDQLNGQPSINITTDGNVSRPVGWLPEYDNLPMYMFGMMLGLMVTALTFLLNYLAPKRKRGLPEM